MVARKNPLVHDPDVRLRFLDLVRAGAGRYEAASAVGLSHAQFAYAHRQSAEFREELAEALDASVEPVIRMLRTRAVNEGDVSAAKEYLRHQAPPPRGAQSTVNHRVQVELPADLSRVGELSQRLRERQAALGAGDYDYDDAILVEEGDED